MDKRNLLKKQIAASNKAINKEIEKAFQIIVKIVKDCGGVLKTPATSGKSVLYAYYEAENDTEKVTIQGLRWDEELGLCLCTNDMLDNYQYDNNYCFEYYFDFEGEDFENLNRALDDPSYYVELDKYNLDYEKTILSIIKGLADYL